MTQFSPGRFEVLPLVIKNLLIINVLFFLAQQTVGAHGPVSMVDLLALHHVQSPLFKPWQLVTHLFLHGDFWHLFWNMVVLWMFGSVLENLWGPRRFLTFYFICGIGAAIIHLAFLWFDYSTLLNDFQFLKHHSSPGNITGFYQKYGLFNDKTATGLFNDYAQNADNSFYLRRVISYISDVTTKAISRPTLGASGAVSGVLAAFIYLFPNAYLYVYLLLPVKAKWLGLIYFGRELLLAILNIASDNVARWAHIGGALVGLILVLTWNKTNRRRFY